MNNNNLVSKYLLEREIKRYDNDPDLMESNPMFYFMCKKELVLIEKIHSSCFDFRGSIEDVMNRLDGCEIIIDDPKNIKDMAYKAHKYDMVKQIMEGK